MDEELNPQSTSLMGLQMVESPTNVNMHRLDTKELYHGEINYTMETSSIGFNVKSPFSKQASPEKESYDISYSAGF